MTGKKSRALRITLTVSGLAVLGVGGALAAMASRYVPLVSPGTLLKGESLTGLTREEAEAKIKSWWADASQRPVELVIEGMEARPSASSAASLGVRLDETATLAQVPFDDFWTDATRRLSGRRVVVREVAPVLMVERGPAIDQLATFVEENSPGHAPAKVRYEGGKIVRVPEKVGMALDREGALQTIAQGADRGGPVTLPVKTGTPKISESELAKIADVVSEYSTRYSEGNRNRAHNIRNAADRLDGLILMPGEVFSFNKTLGQRTAKNGFKVAGVYNNGRHDFDIGGGICQVSSTLYNSVLLANLEVKVRSCHTFPVPYVPIGRDATVSFPAPDFAFRNNTDAPIALAARAGGGSITFRILGIKDPGLKVAIESAGHTSWSRGEKVVNDSSLPPGKRVVEEKGGAGHRVTTYRVVYRNGEVAERQGLGVSHYTGGPRIVRVNKAAPKANVVEVPAGPVEDEHPDAPGPGPMDGAGDGG